MMAEKIRVAKKSSIVEIEGNPVKNELLLNLPPACDGVFKELTFVKLRTHEVLQEPEEPIKYAYFLNSGLASILSITKEGKSVEVGITGKEGCTALPIAAGLKTSAHLIVVQVEGTAFRISSQSLANVLHSCPPLVRRMQQYSHILGMQGSQIAVCNRIHDVHERLARWLLMSQDRLQTNIIPLTHEFLSHMLGTRRSSVTVAAGVLQKSGLITYNRGAVRIVDRDRLQDASCDCYEQIVIHTDTWKKEANLDKSNEGR